MNPSSYSFGGGRRGVTLIELTVAVILTSIVITIVYASWNHLVFYTTVQKRRGSLQNESTRITDQMITKLHKAQRVIRWSPDEILFTVSEPTDTIHYSFDGTSLRCNDKPIPMLLPGTSIDRFTIDNLNSNDPSSPYLFRITLRFVTKQGDTTSNDATVLVNKPYGEANGNDFMW